MAKDYTFPEEIVHMQMKHKSALEVSCFTLLAEYLLFSIFTIFSYAIGKVTCSFGWCSAQEMRRLPICEINLPLSYLVVLTMLLGVGFPECRGFFKALSNIF